MRSGIPGDRGAPVRQPQRQTAGDAQRGERHDERVRHPSPDVDDAVHEADRQAGREHHRDDREPGVDRAEREGPDDRRRARPSPHGEVHAARDDDQQLAHREHADDRRLGEDVADVPGRQEDRLEDGEEDHEQQEHQHRSGLDQAHDERQQGDAALGRSGAGATRLGGGRCRPASGDVLPMLVRVHHHPIGLAFAHTSGDSHHRGHRSRRAAAGVRTIVHQNIGCPTGEAIDRRAPRRAILLVTVLTSDESRPDPPAPRRRRRRHGRGHACRHAADRRRGERHHRGRRPRGAQGGATADRRRRSRCASTARSSGTRRETIAPGDHVHRAQPRLSADRAQPTSCRRPDRPRSAPSRTARSTAFGAATARSALAT